MADNGWPTLADVHAAVTRLEARVERALTTLESHQAQIDAHGQALSDHRQRIDQLQQWRSWVRGGLAVVALLAGAGLTAAAAAVADMIGG